MSESSAHPQLPIEFAAAVASIERATQRAELTVQTIPAPAKLAPHSIALSADVSPNTHAQDSELGTGRFILLYDPDEPEAWGGRFRVVCFAQAPLEVEIGIDPFLARVAWSWLVDALDARDAQYARASGTATSIVSTGFGELAAQGDGAQLELRASWSPLTDDIGPHVQGWGELLCMLAGLPPENDGVSLLNARRVAHSRSENAEDPND